MRRGALLIGRVASAPNDKKYLARLICASSYYEFLIHVLMHTANETIRSRLLLR